MVVVFGSPIKTNKELRPIASLLASRFKKAAERPSARSRETAGRSSAGSVTAAAVRKDKERKVKIEAWSALTVALPHM